MRIRKIFGYSKTTTAVLLVLAGTLSLIAAGSYTTRTNASPAKDSGASFKSAIFKLPTKLPLLNLFDGPTVATDKADYPIGAIVTITGTNWQRGETVTLQVTDDLAANDPNHVAHAPWDVVADVNGNISSSWVVDEDADGLLLTLTATGTVSGSVSTTFTDANPSANLDQCANDPSPSPSNDGCDTSATQWVNGNLGASKSVYFEGDSIPYRLTFDNLSNGSGNSHTVTIEWDTTQSSTHAIDYLTSYNRSVLDANPCLGVSGCDPNTFMTFGIPKDPQVDNGSGSPIAQAPGVFTFYGGNISNVSSYTYADGTGFTGNKSARITITFTASVANPVLAWGGHIAQRRAGNGSGGWGDTNAAVLIPGSPYHTRLIDLDGAGGNQDRSLSADAVVFPGSITIIKDTVPNGPQDFAYTTTGGLTPSTFSLDDDSDPTLSNTQNYPNIVNFTTYTVTETQVTGWVLNPISCSVTSPNGGTQTVTIPSVSIKLNEGENVTCTFTNTENFDVTHGKIKVVKVTNPNPDPTDPDAQFQFAPSWGEISFFLSNGGSHTSPNLVPSSDPSNPVYNVSETIVPPGWELQSATCDNGSDPLTNITVTANHTVTCTFTNRLKPKLTLAKHVVGGSANASAWLLTATGASAGFSGNGTPATGVDASVGPNIVDVGVQYTLSESGGPSNYSSTGVWSCDGGTFASPNKITLAAGQNVTCTITNTRDQGYLQIKKVFDPLTSGFTGPFTIHYDCGAGDHTVSLAAGASSTPIGPFDAGTSCTVSEPSLPTAPTGWTFGTPSISGSPATIVKGDSSTPVLVTVTNSITRDQGYLKISKSFDAKTSGFNGTFAIVYNCGAGDQTVNLGAGQTATVGPLDTGTSCTVTEPILPSAPSGWTFGAPSITGSPATITKGDQAAAVLVTVTNSITRDQGYFKIKKVFDPLASGFAGNFTVHYDCGAGQTGDVLLTAGATSSAIGPFDTGTHCAVTEPSTPTAPTGWTFGTPSVDISPVTIVKDTSATTTTLSTVTNSISRDLGNFKITKTTSNPDGATLPANFTGTYNCGTGYTGTWSIASPGGSQTITGIPTGNSCSVTEDALSTISGYTWGTPTFTPSSIVVSTKGGTFEIVVHNSITHDRGTFTIAKTTNNLDGATLPSFTMNYDCGLDTNGSALTGSRSVASGGSATVTGIPTGNTCSVTEVAPTAIPGYTWGTPTYDPTSIVISSTGGTFKITVGNSITRDHGSLVLAKGLTGGPSGYTGPFTINYNCGTGFTGSVSVSAGSSQTVSGIPTGTSCTVSETPPTPLTGYSFGAPTFAPSDTVTIPAGNGSSVTVTTNNTLTRDVGSLVLAKALTGGPAGYTGPFTINYDCGAGFTGSVSVTAGGSQTVSGIPTGTSCTVSETLPTPPTGYSFGTPSFSPSNSATIPAGNGSSITVTTNNSLTRDTGKLKIAKTLSNPDGASVPASFTVNYNCGTGFTGQVTVSVSTPATVSGIPTGNVCSVTEVAPSPIAGYTWGTITYTPTSIAIDTKGATFCITVGNSITRDRGTLTVVKNVINDNGGTATVSAFGLNTSAGSLTFDSGVASGTTTTYTSQTITVVTGTYTLKENDVYGYAEGTWNCTGAAGTVVPTFNNGSVQVGKGENVVCSITNNDQPGTIVIVKNAKPAQGTFSFDTTGVTSGSGTNWPTNFQLTGSTASNGNTRTFTVDKGTYSVHEGMQLSWVLTGIGGGTPIDLDSFNCTVSGSGGSSGVGKLSTAKVNISIFNGDTVTCTFENTGSGATRTQGFWATHPELAQIAWFGGSAFGHTFPGVAGVSGISDTTLCGRPIDTLGKLMGGFWSGVSNTSTGKKRSALDQARMQLLQQLLAAELNASAFGSAPGSGTFAGWESAYCGTNQNAISTAQQQAGSFNSQGDSSTFTPGTSADSKSARAGANYTWWDVLP